MIEIIKSRGEGLEHIQLKEIAKKRLKAKRCKNISEEFVFKKDGKKYIFDVVGFKGKKMFIIECGGIKQEKVEFIKSLKDVEFFHLPYGDSYYSYSESGIVEIKIIGCSILSSSIFIKGEKPYAISGKILDMIQKEDPNYSQLKKKERKIKK